MLSSKRSSSLSEPFGVFFVFVFTLNLHLVTTTNFKVWSFPRISSLHKISSCENKAGKQNYWTIWDRNDRGNQFFVLCWEWKKWEVSSCRTSMKLVDRSQFLTEGTRLVKFNSEHASGSMNPSPYMKKHGYSTGQHLITDTDTWGGDGRARTCPSASCWLVAE